MTKGAVFDPNVLAYLGMFVMFVEANSTVGDGAGPASSLPSSNERGNSRSTSVCVSRLSNKLTVWQPLGGLDCYILTLSSRVSCSSPLAGPFFFSRVQYYSEYMVLGSTFLFREGRAKGIGKIRRVIN